MGLKTISYLYLPVPGTRYFLAIHGQLSKIICWFFIEMLFFSPIISLFSIIFMIFSLSPIAYFPFLSWDCCHVEQAAAAAVGSSVGGDTDTSFRSRGSIESDLITWLVLSTCFSYASCSKLYFWADEDRFRVVSNGWNPKIPSTFPKCSSWFSQVRMFLYVLLHKLLPPWARLAQAKTQEASS